MASLLTQLHCILLIARLGFVHAVLINAGGQPPLKLFHHWCAQKKDEGPCKAVLERFYFDTDTRRCELFEYGGCRGNDNNFETLEECEDMCLVKANKSPCHLRDEPGPCRGLVPRYFFNSSANKCQRFFYGGCFGNANNFRKLKDCQDRCQPGNNTEEPQDLSKIKEEAPHISREASIMTRNNTEEPQNASEVKEQASILTHTIIDATSRTQPQIQIHHGSESDICMSPRDKGDCSGAEKRFHFNATTRRCHSFIYSGCGGNKNNFVHRRSCMKTCLKDSRNRIRIKSKNANSLLSSI